MDTARIRNFSIIAHIDHGKSTLADRLLEETKTIPPRKMREQVLDSMELERERGITIKMQPVRMRYDTGGAEYELNLIDTPGHIDFSYEVSRALQAVEGVLLLVDATQGVQAQTFTVLQMARDLGLVIIPVINKIDLPLARVDDTRDEIVRVVGCAAEDVIAVSGKTGAGVAGLLETIVERIPAPREEFPTTPGARALVFDFEYSVHLGVLVYVRVFDGHLRRGDTLTFTAANERCGAIEVGVFAPGKTKADEIGPGEIGYIVTGIKQPGRATVGDTILRTGIALPPIAGYQSPRPVVWASIYPESQDDFNTLRQALERLHLSDASFTYDEESSGSLGRGYRCGFLGMLHLEIITERLRREYDLRLVIATPTISYTIIDEVSGKREDVYSPANFPIETKGKKILEPWVRVTIITPPDYLNPILQLLYEHEAVVASTDLFSDNRTEVVVDMPLRELMRNFFDEIKSVSSGFASLAYTILEARPADVVRLDILVNGDIVSAFSRITARRRVEREASELVEKLQGVMPRQMIVIKIQAQALGRILSARSISAMRKDVTGYLYGGDITRKMKLREKQKKGKKKMQQFGKVDIPQDVFLKMVRGSTD